MIPGQICCACQVSGRQHFVVGIQGSVDGSSLTSSPHKIIRLGAIGDIISEFKKQRIEEVVMVGSITRPPWQDLRPDFRGLKLLPKLLTSRQGDGDILKIAISELEEEGFRVVGVDKVLPDLLTPRGKIGALSPSSTSTKDISFGISVAKTIGDLDIGQAVVIQQGMVLGVEAAEGTKSLLCRCSRLSKKGAKGVLIKIKKPHQDARADLPTIGPETVLQVNEAGLGGVAVEAGSSLIIEREEVIRLADGFGIFVLGVDLSN
ncbi:MAG: UDP-2,3-diacylglucosamine pyrophosphatase [Rhodospirillaceae bacterium]|nr:UDP-2,3-diacylglucosamine pyrophosphatase [Rhodospirillaceae bacterium]